VLSKREKAMANFAAFFVGVWLFHLVKSVAKDSLI